MGQINFFIPLRAPTRSKHSRLIYDSNVPPYIPQIETLDPNEVYHLGIILFYKSEQCTDLDNSIKTIIDSFKGRVIQDDRQIKSIWVRAQENSPKVRIQVYLRLLDSMNGLSTGIP